MSSALEDAITYTNLDQAQEVHLRPLKVNGGNENTYNLSPLKHNTDSHAAVEDSTATPGQSEELQSWNRPRRNTLRVRSISCLFFLLHFWAERRRVWCSPPIPLNVLPSILYRSILDLPVASRRLHHRSFIEFNNPHPFRPAGHCCSCKLVQYCCLCGHIGTSTIPAIVVMYAIAGFGYGLIDGGWNAWTGNLANTTAVRLFFELLARCNDQSNSRY